MRSHRARAAARTMRIAFTRTARGMRVSPRMGIVTYRATVQGAVAAVEAAVGGAVPRGGVLLRLESMKMEFPVEAEGAGVVHALHVKVGDAVEIGDALVDVMPVVKVGFGLIEKSAVVIVEPLGAESDGVPRVMTGVWLGFDEVPQPVWAAKFWVSIVPLTVGWPTPSTRSSWSRAGPSPP